MLTEILRTMYVEPELLDELSKEQKEVLFNKIREEQIRRWSAQKYEMDKILDAKRARPPVPRLKFAQYTDIWEDKDEDQKAKEAAKRIQELEKKREQEAILNEQKEAKVLAEIEVQQAIAKKRALSELAIEELQRKEQMEKKRQLEEAEKAKLLAQEREQYMSLKEARLAAEAEAKAAKELSDKIKQEELRVRKEQERLEAEHKAIEAKANTMRKSMEIEIYASFTTTREAQKKAKEDEEKNLEKNYAESERRAKQHEEEQRAAAVRARNLLKGTVDYLPQRGGSVGSSVKKQSSIKAPGRYNRPLPPPTGPAAQPIEVQVATVVRQDSMRQAASIAKDGTLKGDLGITEQQVKEWWKMEESVKMVGKDEKGHYQPWFHGIISRQETESLLSSQPVGSFLVRVSARIFGYTLSFVDTNGFKHFLIDSPDGKYIVCGVQSSRGHKDLNTLIQYHGSIPVSKMGTTLNRPLADKAYAAQVNPGAKKMNKSIAALLA